MLGVLCGAAVVGMGLGDVAQARHAAAGRCMEAVVPKCTYPQFFFCAKKSKCGSCAKWICRSGAAPH